MSATLVARPLSMTPRQGRELQRYDSAGERLISGVVPFYRGELVMITSQSSGAWILPKGGWEKDESAQEAAAREAYEEAGVLGTLMHALPDVRFASKKGGRCRMVLFVMEVTELLDKWPESQQRRRALLSVEEALAKTKPEMVSALTQMLRLGLHLPFVRTANNNTPPSAALPIPASEAVEAAAGASAEGATTMDEEEEDNAFVATPAKTPLSTPSKTPDN